MSMNYFKSLPLLIVAKLESVHTGGLPTTGANSNSIGDIMKLVFGVAGALALLMITIAGLSYILSRGDPQKTATARNAIFAALAGLAIAIAGESIVIFVINRVN